MMTPDQSPSPAEAQSRLRRYVNGESSIEVWPPDGAANMMRPDIAAVIAAPDHPADVAGVVDRLEMAGRAEHGSRSLLFQAQGGDPSDVKPDPIFATAIALITSQAAEVVADRLEMVAGLLRGALAAFKAGDTNLARACAHAALDFASNDAEALAEGRAWADPEPASEAQLKALSGGDLGRLRKGSAPGSDAEQVSGDDR